MRIYLFEISAQHTWCVCMLSRVHALRKQKNGFFHKRRHSEMQTYEKKLKE